MMRWIEKAALAITGARLLFFLGGLIALHFLVMLSFMHSSRLTRHEMRRNQVIQKIVNVIHLVEATPTVDRKTAILAATDSIVSNTITEKPAYALQFHKISWWAINSALRKQRGGFEISLQLLPKQWLNINATVYTHLLMNQVSLLLIEIFAVLLVFLAALMINRYTRPLKSFKEAAMAVRNATTKFPENIEGPDAVQEVVNAVYSMRKRIAQQAEDRTKMLAAISHDLRTPITRMTLRAELLEDVDMQQALLKDLSEMEQMVNETLAFARADAGSATPKKFDLVSLLDSVCNDLVDMGSSVYFSCAEKRIPFEGKSLALQRAVTNLVTNGCRYGEKVWVSCQLLKDRIRIEVEDDGPGLPEDELDKVLDPFYRHDQSRSRESGGVGLGLAVAKDLVSLHGGTLSLHVESKGLLARIDLPLP